MDVRRRALAGVHALIVGAGLIGLSGGCGGGPQDGAQVQEGQDVASRRQKGIRDAMKSGAYGRLGKKGVEKK
jgi:hypothetical protein